MTVPTALRLFACAVLLVLLPVIDAQSNSYACGQSTFSGLAGNITSPNYPYYYENSQHCEYVIEAPSLSTINFTFNALDLEQSYGCYYDWIEITCQSNSISQSVRYCGYGNRAKLSLKPCSRVLVSFSADGSVTGSGFLVSYDIQPITCQGNCAPVANGAGYNCPCDANQTPYTPPPYDQCPTGCFTYSSYCACSSSEAVTFTTTTPPSTTTTLTPACGQSTFSGLRGNITSPNYPYYYGNNQHCDYVIEAPSLSTINFTFDSINLEYTSTCYWDWIEFTCESNSISRTVRYCGFGNRAVLSLKPCSRVLVSFTSDGSVTYSGFLVSYDIEPITCQGDCTPVANDAGYTCACDANQTPYTTTTPTPYNQCPDSSCLDASTYCACSQTPTNTNSSQQTTSFEWYNPGNDTESSTIAYNDSNFVSCYECWYSGNSFDTDNMSSCSPEFNSREGRVCRGVACQTYSYSYPSYASAYVSQQCVDAYYYEESLRNCANQSQVYGYNYFFEGDQCCSSYKDSYYEVKYCFCASDYCNNYIIQPSQSNDTTTSSSASNATNGTTTPPFTTTLSPACGQSTFGGLRGNITSPNYPFSYGNNQHCNYVIEAPSLSTINFTFDSINLEYTSTCYWDWIEFTCESNSVSRTVRYCGFGNRPVLSLKPCSRVLVSFTSDGSVTYSGFLVSYDIEPITCQGDCTPVANDAGYTCACDADQTPYTTTTPTPYNQCPYSSCLDASTYCACSQTPTNTNSSQQTTSFEWYNPGNDTESSTIAYNDSNFVSCYECWYSGNSFDTANMSSCSPEFNSRERRVCRGVACQTYSYSYPSYAYAYVSQQCVDAYYYEESLRNCANQSQVYGYNYFFEGDQCCSSYRDSYAEVKYCFCASDYCNNYILQPSQSNDTTTSSSASNPTNGTTIPPLVTGNAGNSSGNISQSTTRTPSNGTTPRPATLNAGNTTQSTTRMLSNGTTTARPATLNAGNTTQSTTRAPSNGTTTPRSATLNAGNTTQSTTRMLSNGTTTARPATLNAGNTSQSTTRMPSNGTTTARPATLNSGNTTQSTTRIPSNGTTTFQPATLNAGNTTQSTTRAPSNGTTTPRPATLNAGNTTQSTTRAPSNGTTTPRPATLNAGNATQSTTRLLSNGTTTPRPATLNAGNTTQSTTRAI